MASIKSVPRRLAAVSMFTPLLPLIAVQARQVRRAMPKLDDASGPCSGVFGPPPARMRIVVVGESTVSGVGARTHTHSLSGRLAASLGQALHSSVAWQAVGQSGANARELADVLRQGLGAAKAPRAARVDCAFVALGVNDVIERTPLARWKSDVAALVDLLATRHGARTVVLLGVPPMHRFPALPQPLRAFLGARACELDEELAALAGEDERLAHVPTPVDGPLEYFCADRFHPSEAGYAVWARHTVAAVHRFVAERAQLQNGNGLAASTTSGMLADARPAEAPVKTERTATNGGGRKNGRGAEMRGARHATVRREASPRPRGAPTKRHAARVRRWAGALRAGRSVSLR
jgi:lysophospholipase L1-like esterase